MRSFGVGVISVVDWRVGVGSLPNWTYMMRCAAAFVATVPLKIVEFLETVMDLQLDPFGIAQVEYFAWAAVV